jgi:hypothetical protein
LYLLSRSRDAIISEENISSHGVSPAYFVIHPKRNLEINVHPQEGFKGRAEGPADERTGHIIIERIQMATNLEEDFWQVECVMVLCHGKFLLGKGGRSGGEAMIPERCWLNEQNVVE